MPGFPHVPVEGPTLRSQSLALTVAPELGLSAAAPGTRGHHWKGLDTGCWDNSNSENNSGGHMTKCLRAQPQGQAAWVLVLDTRWPYGQVTSL